MISLIALAAVEIIIFIIGIHTNPFIMVLIPIVFIFLWWLISNPTIALMMLSLTAIIKGYLLIYFPITEYFDITVISTLIIWLGLIKIFFEESPIRLRKIEIQNNELTTIFYINDMNFNPNFEDNFFSLANPLIN